MKRRSFVAAGAYGLGAVLVDPLARWRELAGRGLWATSVFPAAGAAAAGAADDARMAWWREARFGLFLHWGLYSILAGEWEGRTDYAEWIRNNAHIPIDVYDKLVGRFNPVRFDADAWVGMAKNAGMKYVTLTTKHHDGFCLFDNTLTDFCIRSTPFKRDVCAELAAASARAGIQQCWYHSIMDWHHPDYLPRRDWEAETRSAAGAKYSRYVEYLHGSVAQLLKRYGDVGVMWYDGNWESTWTHEMGRALYDYCRQLQPNVICNNRLEGWSQAPITDHLGDFSTPEQTVPATGLPRRRLGIVHHDESELGLQLPRPRLQVHGAADRAARRDGVQGRQPAAQRRAEGGRHLPRGERGAPRRHRAMDEGERRRDSRNDGVEVRRGRVPVDHQGEPHLPVRDRVAARRTRTARIEDAAPRRLDAREAGAAPGREAQRP